MMVRSRTAFATWKPCFWAKGRPAAFLTFVLVADSAVGQEKKDEKKDSPPEAVALYADAANFQNNGAFELAVEEWGKFLTKFPKDPLTPKAQHYNGVCNLQLKKFDKAA